MYDLAQLNDMLVLELKDIADQLSIPHAQKTDKKELIYRNLDRQAVAESGEKNTAPERSKRKRIPKANTPTESSQPEAVAAAEIQQQPNVDVEALQAKKEN